MLTLPGRPRQLGPQHFRHVDLDDDLPLEVLAGVEVEVGVCGAGEAIVADDPIGDEVPGTGGDVEEFEGLAQGLDLGDAKLIRFEFLIAVAID